MEKRIKSCGRKAYFQPSKTKMVKEYLPTLSREALFTRASQLQQMENYISAHPGDFYTVWIPKPEKRSGSTRWEQQFPWEQPLPTARYTQVSREASVSFIALMPKPESWCGSKPSPADGYGV